MRVDGIFVIPERQAHVAYQSMRDFIETVGDSLLKEELSSALNGKGAFRKFKGCPDSISRREKTVAWI